jgi:hypothetical protein
LVVGTGDFDGDGKADFVWRNSVTGENYLYLMQGLTVAGEGYIRTVASASWTVVGTGDFDGDGRADILWRNSATGENYIYPMQGLAIKEGEGYIRTVADQNWQVVSVGNFDGNIAPATADILWRNLSTGENYLFPMSGLAIQPSEGYLRTVADRDWKVQPASACPSVSSSPALTLTAQAARTEGVAPLGVFFDATATTSTATTRPFHEIEYQWNFGDAASGAWSATPGMPNLSRNLATGPVAAHVFETPGTYTVCVTAFDGVNTASTSIEITVTDPNIVFAANTLCVGAGSEPVAGEGGCPAGASVLASGDFDAAINDNIANRKRILFRRGDVFTGDTDTRVMVEGPGLIGAFGSGNAPVVNLSGAETVGILISDKETPNFKDWRVMDLEINGSSEPKAEGVLAIGGMDQVTLLRLNIHHVHVGVRLSPSTLDFPDWEAHHLWDQFFMVDSSIQTLIGGSGGNGMFIGAQRFAVLGSVLSDSTGGEHVLRTPSVYKGVIGHNNMSTPSSDKHVLKLHAEPFNVSPTGFTEQIVIADNKFTGGTGSAWTVTLGPQDGSSDETVRNVIVERNWFAPHASQQVAVVVWAQDVTVRNNLFDLTGTSQVRGVFVDQRGIEPPPANVHVYNNTFYSNSIGSFVAMNFFLGDGMLAKNNLGFAPDALDPPGPVRMVSGTATEESNTDNAQIPVSPAFVGSIPLVPVPADFALGAASSDINAGTSVPVFSDFFRRSRPLSGPIDRGAFEKP